MACCDTRTQRAVFPPCPGGLVSPGEMEAPGPVVVFVVRTVVEARIVGDFAEDSVAPVGPAIGAAAADAAPQSVLRIGEAGARDIDGGAVEKLVTQIGDAVDVGAHDARAVVPGPLMVECQPRAAEQAVAITQRDRRAEPIGKAVESDLRIGKLRLRRQQAAPSRL